MTSLAPTDDDLPFGSTGSCTSTPINGNCIARLVVKAVERDNTADEKVCFAPGDGWTGASACTEFTYDFGGSEVRLGRLRFGNAFGSELQGLDVPFWLESWKSVGTATAPLGAFRTESGDACSAPLLGKPALKAVAGSLQPGDFASPALQGPTGGAGLVRLAAPGKEGSVSVGLEGLEGASPAVPWLLYDWNGSATRQAARGLATFGIYRGSDALIFRRESYR
jgi:MSHA biogenesis protein MshQ